MEITIMWWSKACALALAAVVARGAEQSCPGSLKIAGQEHRLHDASLFDGNPAEHAELLPDTNNGETWTLPPYRERAGKANRSLYWVCRYKKTTRTVTLKIDPAAQVCKVELSNSRAAGFCK